MAIVWEDVRGSIGKAVGRKAGQVKVVVTQVSGPSSYTTGGFNVVVGELGEIQAAIVKAGSGYDADIDFANSSGNTLRIKAYYYDYTASAAGAAKEVAAGTDLSGVKFTIIAFGW